MAKATLVSMAGNPADKLLLLGRVLHVCVCHTYCNDRHPAPTSEALSVTPFSAPNPPDDLLLVFQLAANEALVLLIDGAVQLARRRGRHIPLWRPQRRLYPVHLRRSSGLDDIQPVPQPATLQADYLLQQVSAESAITWSGGHRPIPAANILLMAPAKHVLDPVGSAHTPLSGGRVGKHSRTSRFVCMIHLRRAMMSACVSPNLAVFFSATSTAFDSSSTYNIVGPCRYHRHVDCLQALMCIIKFLWQHEAHSLYHAMHSSALLISRTNHYLPGHALALILDGASKLRTLAGARFAALPLPKVRLRPRQAVLDV